MSSVRGLLARGNGKLGEAIHHWSLSAVSTCPGSTSVCRQVCYARSGRYRLASVKEKLEWNDRQSLRDDFADLMVREVRRKGCLVIRIHASGDFYDAEYARKWLDVMRRSPKPRYYFYTRSYAVPAIAEVLEEMARLDCCRAWYSCDAERRPESVPEAVRLAYLQADADESAEGMNLVFRVRRLRRRIALPLTCPHETPQGEKSQVNCGSCRRCYS
jgi:hypothetical protein